MHDYVSECADDTVVVYPAVELWRWGRVAGVWLSAGADPTSPVPSDNCFSKQAVVSWNRHCSGRLRACVVMWIVSESGDWCWVHFCEYIINGTCLCKMANIECHGLLFGCIFHFPLVRSAQGASICELLDGSQARWSEPVLSSRFGRDYRDVLIGRGLIPGD